MIRDILKMGAPRRLRVEPIEGIRYPAPKVIVADIYEITDATKGVGCEPAPKAAPFPSNATTCDVSGSSGKDAVPIGADQNPAGIISAQIR